MLGLAAQQKKTWNWPRMMRAPSSSDGLLPRKTAPWLTDGCMDTPAQRYGDGDGFKHRMTCPRRCPRDVFLLQRNETNRLYIMLTHMNVSTHGIQLPTEITGTHNVNPGNHDRCCSEKRFTTSRVKFGGLYTPPLIWVWRDSQTSRNLDVVQT